MAPVQWLDNYDPDRIEEIPIKYVFGRIAARRKAAKVRFAKKP